MKLITLLVAAALCCAPAARADGYRIVNLMPDFWAFQARAQGLDTAAQAELFRQLVVAPHPEAYTAEVIGLPRDKPYDAELARRYTRVHAVLADRMDLMRRMSDAIVRDLPRYEARFREVFPDLAYRGDVYFMHSLGGFDGATRTVAGRTALLFGLDMMAYVYGADVDPEPFFHHELFHVYHAQFAGAGTEGDDDPLFAALWREGLATHVAQALNPQAGGVAIFGLPRSTPARVQASLPQLAQALRAVLDSRRQEDYARWFLGGKEDAEVPARSGYVIGYLVAGKLAKQHPLPELARLPVEALRPAIEAALEELATPVR